MVDAKNLDKEYSDIKAGVGDVLDDAPSPTEEADYGPEDSEQSNEKLDGIDYGGEQEESVPEAYVDQSQDYQVQPQGLDIDRVHAIIESVISEKLDELTSSLGDLSAWKEKINNDIVAVKQEVLRITERFENLQGAVLGRVKEYDSGIRDVHTEMKALEKVLGKIIEPLITNVKELSKITEDLKKNKK